VIFKLDFLEVRAIIRMDKGRMGLDDVVDSKPCLFTDRPYLSESYTGMVHASQGKSFTLEATAKVYLELHWGRWKCRDCRHIFAELKELLQSRSKLTRQAEAEAPFDLPTIYEYASR
jgi:hypothetical protein